MVHLGKKSKVLEPTPPKKGEGYLVQMMFFNWAIFKVSAVHFFE